MIEVLPHPVDARRVIVRMTGAEHMFLNLTRTDAYELGRVLSASVGLPSPQEPSVA
jgi:hypothetical protein